MLSTGAVESAYMLIDLAGGDVVVSGQGQGKVPFVVPEIQIDFGTWIKSQHAAKLTMVFHYEPDCRTKHSPCSAGAIRPASTDT